MKNKYKSQCLCFPNRKKHNEKEKEGTPGWQTATSQVLQQASEMGEQEEKSHSTGIGTYTSVKARRSEY